MQETKTTNTKPYPSISADSELNKSAIKYLSDWRKEHPENLINLEEVEQGNALFQKALKKLDYEECARIDTILPNKSRTQTKYLQTDWLK